MISRRLFLCALPGLLLSSQRVLAGQLKTIRLVYHHNVPPYSYQSRGRVNGILIDLIDELTPQLNTTFSHQSYPWKRAQLLVERGKADAFCCPVTAAREEYALFAPTPITTLHESALFFDPNSPNAARIKAAERIEDLYALKAATFLGNSSHDEIWKDHPKVIQVPEVEQILHMLLRGRFDFYFADPIVTRYLMRQEGIEGQLEGISVGHILKQDKIVQMRFGLRRSYPEAEKVVAAIDSAIKQTITPEVHHSIVNQYI